MIALLLTLALAAEPEAPAPSDTSPPPAEPAEAPPPSDTSPPPTETTSTEATAEHSELLTEEQFTDLVRELLKRYGPDEVVITTPGFESFDQLRQLLSDAQVTRVSLIRASELVDADKATARFVRRDKCALYVSRRAQRYQVSTHGKCAPPGPRSMVARRASLGPQGGLLGPPEATADGAELDLGTRMMIHSEWDLAVAKTRAPNPTAAAVLSGLAGYGAGHFYAKAPINGTAHMSLQLLGAAVFLGGYVRLTYLEHTDYREINFVMDVGLLTMLLGRVLDTAMAPISASRTAVRELEEERDRRGY